MISLLVADRVRRHVREHEVGGSAERFPEPLRRILVHEIHLEDFDALDRVGRKQIDSDDLRLRSLAPDDLAPSAGRDSEIDRRLDALEQAEPLVELEQFIGGAAAVILRLRAPDIRVVELPFEPAGR
jgi:hypothetical protein